MAKINALEGKGLGVATAYNFEDEPSCMIHEQLARLYFIESQVDMNSKRVLDYGCGTGYNSYYISERQYPNQIIGVDINEDCIDYCKSKYSTTKTEYFVQDCLIHNPKLGLFDVVISCEVIEHLTDQNLFLDTLIKYLEPNNGVVLISTPNKAIFSLSKRKSFLNYTHIKELFFDEFMELLCDKFSACEIFSQVHRGQMHEAYVNYLCFVNLIHVIRYEFFGNNLIGKLASKIGRVFLYALQFKMKSKNYPNVCKRKYSDFEFVKGFDSSAVWFVARCSKPK